MNDPDAWTTTPAEADALTALVVPAPQRWRYVPCDPSSDDAVWIVGPPWRTVAEDEARRVRALLATNPNAWRITGTTGQGDHPDGTILVRRRTGA
jgi:hypothetical protein